MFVGSNPTLSAIWFLQNCLGPMLLNELQQQQSMLQALSKQNAAQAGEIRSLKQQQGQYATKAELHDLQQQLQAARRGLQAQDVLVARTWTPVDAKRLSVLDQK